MMNVSAMSSVGLLRFAKVASVCRPQNVDEMQIAVRVKFAVKARVSLRVNAEVTLIVPPPLFAQTLLVSSTALVDLITPVQVERHVSIGRASQTAVVE